MDAILQVRIYELSIFGTRDAWCFCGHALGNQGKDRWGFMPERLPGHLVTAVRGETIWMEI